MVFEFLIVDDRSANIPLIEKCLDCVVIISSLHQETVYTALESSKFIPVMLELFQSFSSTERNSNIPGKIVNIFKQIFKKDSLSKHLNLNVFYEIAFKPLNKTDDEGWRNS